MSAILRPATEADCHEVIRAAIAMLGKTPAKHMAFANATKGASHLWERFHGGRMWVYGDYAIVVDIGAPWWAEEDFLIEELFIRFRTSFGNTVESAVAKIATLAEILDCAAVVTGDTQVGKMDSHYLAAGYSAIGKQFYKEI